MSTHRQRNVLLDGDDDEGCMWGCEASSTSVGDGPHLSGAAATQHVHENASSLNIVMAAASNTTATPAANGRSGSRSSLADALDAAWESQERVLEELRRGTPSKGPRRRGDNRANCSDNDDEEEEEEERVDYEATELAAKPTSSPSSYRTSAAKKRSRNVDPLDDFIVDDDDADARRAYGWHSSSRRRRGAAAAAAAAVTPHDIKSTTKRRAAMLSFVDDEEMVSVVSVKVEKSLTYFGAIQQQDDDANSATNDGSHDDDASAWLEGLTAEEAREVLRKRNADIARERMRKAVILPISRSAQQEQQGGDGNGHAADVASSSSEPSEDNHQQKLPPTNPPFLRQAFSIFNIPTILDTRQLTVKELKAELGIRNLSLVGTRDVLVQRLDRHIKSAERDLVVDCQHVPSDIHRSAKDTAIPTPTKRSRLDRHPETSLAGSGGGSSSSVFRQPTSRVGKELIASLSGKSKGGSSTSSSRGGVRKGGRQLSAADAVAAFLSEI